MVLVLNQISRRNSLDQMNAIAQVWLFCPCMLWLRCRFIYFQALNFRLCICVFTLIAHILCVWVCVHYHRLNLGFCKRYRIPCVVPRTFRMLSYILYALYSDRIRVTNNSFQTNCRTKFEAKPLCGYRLTRYAFINMYALS